MNARARTAGVVAVGATLAAIPAGLGRATPTVFSVLAMVTLAVLVLAARARLRAGPVRARDALLGTVLFLSLGAVALFAGFGRLVAGGTEAPCEAAVAMLGTLVVVLLLRFEVPRWIRGRVEGEGLESPALPLPYRVAILAPSLAYHAYVLLVLPPFIQIDSYCNLWEPPLFTTTSQAYHHTPLYAELVRLFTSFESPFPGLVVIVAIQHVFVIALALEAARLVWLETGSRVASVAVGLAMGLDGHLAVYAQSIMAEVISTALLVGAVSLLIQSRRPRDASGLLLGAGLLSAFATLTKQGMQFWPAIGFVGILLYRRPGPRLAAVAIFLGAALAPLGAMIAHNKAYTGYASLSNAEGHNLMYRIVYDLPSPVNENAAPDDEMERARRIVWEERAHAWLGPYIRIKKELGWTDDQVNKAVIRFYFDQMRRHPGQFAWNTLVYAHVLLVSHESTENAAEFHETCVQAAPAGWNGLPVAKEIPALVRAIDAVALTSRLPVLILAALSPLLARGALRRLALACVFTAAHYFVLAAVVELPVLRYRLPASPFIAIAAAVAAVAIVERVRERRRVGGAA